MATRVDLFKAWLNLVGANPNDCELVDDMEDKTRIGNSQGCYGFVCPADVPTKYIHNTTEMEYRVDCTKCKYNDFWTKEVEE